MQKRIPPSEALFALFFAFENLYMRILITLNYLTVCEIKDPESQLC